MHVYVQPYQTLMQHTHRQGGIDVERRYRVFSYFQLSLRKQPQNEETTLTLPPLCPCVHSHLLAMDRPGKKESLTPQQVAQKAREAQTQERVDQEGRNVPSRHSLSASQSASVPRMMQQGSPALSSSSLSPSILDFTRKTQVDAQAYRTAVRIAELESQEKNPTRNDAVMAEMGTDEPAFSAYPGTEMRRNITVRRSRDRLSLKPDVLPRTPDDVLRRRPKDRPRDLAYGEQVSRATSAITHKRNHGEELTGSYRLRPYPKDDPDEGYRYAGTDASLPKKSWRKLSWRRIAKGRRQDRSFHIIK